MMKLFNKNIIKIISISAVLFVPLFFLIISIKTEEQYKIKEIFNKNMSLIKMVCYKIGIDHRIYCAVIYGELASNYNYFDQFDSFRARLGSDPSLGFSQIKTTTAQWIENEIDWARTLVNNSKTTTDLINKLESDSLNILYSAIYIKEIMNRYYQKYNSIPSEGIIASYYSYGIDYGKVIFSKSYMNSVGKAAKAAVTNKVFEKKEGPQ